MDLSVQDGYSIKGKLFAITFCDDYSTEESMFDALTSNFLLSDLSWEICKNSGIIIGL